MKPAITVLALIQIALLIWMFRSAPQGADQMSTAISGAYVALGALVAFAFTTPAILLARAGKALPFALALATTPLVLFIAFRSVLF